MPDVKLIKDTDKKDKVFETEKIIKDFSFNSEVASVFDDMVSRSVPYYDEMQRMVGELAKDYAKSNSNIYDIGCSTGTTISLLDNVIGEKDIKFIGIDNSQEMLAKAETKLEKLNLKNNYEFKVQDINKEIYLENASVVTMLLTLQFVRPLNRESIMKKIYEGLNKDGCLMMIEKVTSEDTTFNRLFIEHYYDFKRNNGYSEIEISKKREALENVLIPYRMEENFDLLKLVGFKRIEVFFRWYNFCAIIAVK